MTGKPAVRLNYRDLTNDEHEAIEAFAEEYGRNWRDTLAQVYWYNARIWIGPKPNMGSMLHGIRNEFGPTWLYEAYCPRNPSSDKELFRAVRAMGLTIQKRDGEYRIATPSQPEAAYYTTDRSDALGTARAMSKPAGAVPAATEANADLGDRP